MASLPELREQALREKEKVLKQRAEARSKTLVEEQRERIASTQPQEFEQATRQFGTTLNLGIGAQLGQARRGFVQSAARRGLTGSGVEQAGVQAVRAAGQQQFAQSLGEFEGKLLEAQRQQRAGFEAQSFGFLAQMQLIAAQGEIDKEIARFQAQLAADQERARRTQQMLKTAAAIPVAFIGG